MKLRILALLCGALLAVGAACSLANSSPTSNASGSDSGAPVPGSSSDAGSSVLPSDDAGAATDSSSPSSPPSDSSVDAGPGDGGEDAAAADARAGDTLLGFLRSISGTKTVAGEHNRELTEGNFILAMDQVTGHYPGLWGETFSMSPIRLPTART